MILEETLSLIPELQEWPIYYTEKDMLTNMIGQTYECRSVASLFWYGLRSPMGYDAMIAASILVHEDQQDSRGARSRTYDGYKVEYSKEF